jgi:hypothetical protein
MTMSSKVKLELFAAIGLVVAVVASPLLATGTMLPSFKYALAAAAAPQQNATATTTPLTTNTTTTVTPQTDETMMMTEDMIRAKISQLKSEHPVLAAVFDKVQSMDAAQTLRALIGTRILERILEAHGMNMLRFENFTMNPTLP